MTPEIQPSLHMLQKVSMISLLPFQLQAKIQAVWRGIGLSFLMTPYIPNKFNSLLNIDVCVCISSEIELEFIAHYPLYENPSDLFPTHCSYYYTHVL